MAWIKIDRKIIEHWIWNNPIYLKAWMTMIIVVNYEESKSLIHGELIICKRGQSLLSLNSWAEKFGKEWTIQKVRTFFELLKNDSMIELEGLQRRTRLTICKYDSYQERATRRQHANNTQKISKVTRQKISESATYRDEQHTDNKQNSENITTIKEYKEVKNIISTKVDINSHIQKFKNSLYAFCKTKGGLYENETVLEFFNYWSELNKSKTKMRWELQKTFEVEKRLATWIKNEIKFKNGKNNTSTNRPSEEEFLTAITNGIANAQER